MELNGIITTNTPLNAVVTGGIPGFSPIAMVEQTQSGATVTITDKNGTTTANILNGTATDAQVATAVDAWLDDNVAQETGYVLDSTLTMSNAAAPADKVGELKNVLIDPNLANPTLVDKKYVREDTGEILSSNSYVYIEATGISTYHKIHIYTHTTGQPGICFYKADGTYISGIRNYSTADNYLFDNDVDVPDGANIVRVSCLRTARTGLGVNTKLKTIFDGINREIEENTYRIESAKDLIPDAFISDNMWKNGGVDGIDGHFTASNFFLWSGYRDVSKYEAISIEPDNGYRVAFAFYENADGTGVSWVSGKYDKPINASKRFVRVPSGAQYFAMCFQPTTGEQASSAWIDHINVGGYTELLYTADNSRYRIAMDSNTVKSIAHRGDDIVAPQCVAPSYIAARRNGFNIAENDLWLSEDGQFVMWHDTTLTALGDLVDINGYLMYTDGTNYYWVKPSDNSVYTWNGTSYVSSATALSSLTRCNGANYGVNSEYANIGLNLDVLKRIDFGAYRGKSYAGTQILTLEEWVMLCKRLGMEIYIDKKLTYTNDLLTAAANIVKKCGMAKYTSWIGLAGADITLLRTIIPDARVGQLYHPTAELVEAYAPYNTGRGFFFNGNAKSGMTAEAIQLGLNAGFDVEVWFVDTDSYTQSEIMNTIKTAVSYGVTAMTLDHVRVGDAFQDLLI